MDPITLHGALTATLGVKRWLDTANLKHEVGRISAALDLVGAQLDEVLLVDFRPAYHHLEAAKRASSTHLRLAELGNARQNFARLINRPRTGPVKVDGCHESALFCASVPCSVTQLAPRAE